MYVGARKGGIASLPLAFVDLFLCVNFSYHFYHQPKGVLQRIGLSQKTLRNGKEVHFGGE